MNGKLARNSLQTSMLLALRVATQASVLILLGRLLGPATYGNFVAVASLAVMLGLLPNLGAGFVMMARNAREEGGVAKVWRYAWPSSLLLGLLLLAAFLGLARFVTRAPLPTPVLLCIGTAELMLTPFTMLLSFALQAIERVPRSQFVQWMPLGLRVVAALICFDVAFEHRLYAFVTLQLIASAFGVLLGYWATLSHVTLDWRPRLATRDELRQGASYAAMHLVAANPSELDKVVAARAIGSHDAGIYAATARIMSATVMPVTAMLLASQPRLFRHAHESTLRGDRLVRLIAALAFAWGTVSGLGLALASPWLPWLFGDSFDSMARLMPWLAGAAPFLALRLSAGTVLVTQGRPSQRVAFEIVGVAILVVGMIVLAPIMGMRGIALALVFAELGMASLGWWMVMRQQHLPIAHPSPPE